jgi:hypothetical protein
VKKLLLVTAAFVAAVAVFIAFSLPPRRLTLAPVPDGSIPGIIHIHSTRSDGSSGPDDIAAAAARAGLKFIVFTDHGDATRAPDPPTYRSGVLCLDGVEISTSGGHYIAIDMRPSPYPLAGEPRDVVEDVRRLGGFGIAAHPDSPKPELRWKEWTAPFDGIELLNPDTSWRVWAEQARAGDPAAQNARWPARRRLLEALASYPVRSAETIARLARPIGGVLHQWAAIAARRRVVTLAGIDAHAKIDVGGGDPENSRYSLPIPGYEASFRSLSIHVAPDRALTGKAPADAAMIVRAIRNGHLYVAVDGVATPPSFEFTATNDNGTVHEGDELASGTPVRLHVRSNAPAGFTTTVWNGVAVVQADKHEPEFTLDVAADPAVYWIEITSQHGGEPITWLRSNPIYVRGSESRIRPPSRPPPAASRPFVDSAATNCHAEHDQRSAAAFEVSPVGTGEMRFRFGLSGDTDGHEVAALVCDAPAGLAPYDRLAFTTRADHPMRISVQLRAGDGDAAGERWQRSVFVDTYDQERTVYFDDVMPVGSTHTFKPPLDMIRHVLFVVDRTNAKAAASGRVWIKGVALQK